MEETAAWGTYERTATKQARFLGRRTSTVAPTEEPGLPRRRQSTIVPSSAGTHPETGNLRNRRSSSYAMASRQSIVGVLADMKDDKGQSFRQSFVGVLADTKGDRGQSMRDWCKEMGIEDPDEDEEDVPTSSTTEKPVLSAKRNLNLSEETKLDIRRLFSVYFEGTYDVSLDQNISDNTSCLRSLLRSPLKVNGTMPWVQGFVTKHLPIPGVFLFAESCLRGIGQVFFQNNPISGLMILAGIFVQSSRVAVHGIVSVVCGNGTAYLLGMDKGLIRSGLFGYNSYLVGLALSTFGSSSKHGGYSVAVAIATVVFSCFSSVVFVVFGKILVPCKTPPLTLPFNTVVLTYLLATANMARVMTDSVRPPALPDYSDAAQLETEISITAKMFFSGVLRGVGQVFLADSMVAGALVLVGIAACSRISALSALLGSLIGASVAVGTGVPGTSVAAGLYGFNPSLSFTAMLMFYSPSVGSLALGIMAAAVTVIGQQALETLFEPFGLPVMTLPFCVITLPFIILQGTTSMVIAVPLQTMTVPEDHLKKVNSLEDGFQFLKAALAGRGKEGKKGSFSSTTHSRQLSKSIRDLSSVLKKHGNSKEFSSTEFMDLTAVEAPAADPPSMLQRIERFFKGCFRSIKVTGSTSTQSTASRIFSTISHSDDYAGLTVETFQRALKASGLTDPTGLEFAGMVYRLIESKPTLLGQLQEQEFVIFALVSVALVDLREGIGRCFEFIDTDMNGDVTIDEVNAALEYLGKPELSEAECLAFNSVSSQQGGGGVGYGNEEDDEQGVDIIELINFVTVSKIRSIISEFHLQAAAMDQ